MSKADEMFEELGYTVSNGKWEEHLNTTTNTVVDNGYIQIIFYTNRTIYIDSDDIMNMKELQAINKKVEELRMARVKKIIQTIKLHKFKTEVNKKIIEEMDESSYLVWYKDGTCKEVNFKDDLIDILSKDHIKPIRYIFNMSDRIIVDRKIYINTEEVF